MHEAFGYLAVSLVAITGMCGLGFLKLWWNNKGNK